MTEIPLQTIEVSQDQSEGQTSNEGEGHLVTMTAAEHGALLERIRLAEEKANLTEENLQRAMEDMESIRLNF